MIAVMAKIILKDLVSFKISQLKKLNSDNLGGLFNVHW